MSETTKHVVIWTLLLVAIDALLTVVAYFQGTLAHGRSPALDVWDFAKALAIGGILLSTARQVRSRGLMVIGVGAIAIGVVGGTHLHGLIGRWLFPGTSTGVGKFVVLTTAVIVFITTLFVVRDPWENYPTVRKATVLLTIALLASAGLLDLLGTFRGAAIVEESSERLVMSAALACSIGIFRLSLSHR